jgi:pimeloyl-ACP methyl ester carboxylesterase
MADAWQSLRLPDGRVLGYAAYGDPDGLPVLAFHGVPGTRLMYRPADSAARRAGLRLIAVDRPGFGRSNPQPGRRLEDWRSDVALLIGALRLDRFGVVAISGGGPFAVLTASAFPDRVAALGLVSPMGPIRDLHGHVDINLVNRLFFLRFAQRRRVVRVTSGLSNLLFRAAPSFQYDAFVASLPPSDRDILREPRLKAQVIEDVHESLAQGGAGFRDDLRIFSEPWSLDYGRIAAPAVLWQGLADTIVPVDVALELGSRIPGCKIEHIPNAGHFWIYRNFDTVMTTLVRIARQDA